MARVGLKLTLQNFAFQAYQQFCSYFLFLFVILASLHFDCRLVVQWDAQRALEPHDGARYGARQSIRFHTDHAVIFDAGVIFLLAFSN